MFSMSGNIEAIARELLRRRVLTQQKNGQNDLMNALAQATLLDRYDRLPTIDDLKFNRDYLEFVTHDNAERGVRVVVVKGDWSHRVWSNSLDCDVVVFSRFDDKENTVELEGWMPRLEVEEAPFEWWEKDGKRVSYFHSVDNGAFIPMPEEFDFSEPCDHESTLSLSYWDVRFGGWRCLKCDRIVYETSAVTRVMEVINGAADAPGASDSLAA